jgi:prepilin-type N-terminal cleavage/methylation domain-containing protein
MKIFNMMYQQVQKGFTLVEITIVLLIVGLIVGAGFSSLGAYLDNAYQSHTMGNLQVTKRALLDYVLVNRHMPCPDTDNDGRENRTGVACSASVGTIPFDDIGLGAAVTSDDYGNLFGYGVNGNVVNTGDIADSTDSASYFGNQSPPQFTLQTPPTTALPSVPESYTVCKRETNSCTTDAANVEVSAIPAVIVAFNENGGVTNLQGCNSAARGTRETENCDADSERLLWKGTFDNDVFDDQIVTISGYEIKQQVLDLLNTITLHVTDEYDGYDFIVRGDVDSSNDLNVADGVDNKFYIDKTSDTEGGNLNASIVFKDGDDKFHIERNIESGGNAKMGAGEDYVYVGGSILAGGAIYLGDNDDTTDVETFESSDGKDVAIIDGNINSGALLDAGFGNDDVTVNGVVAGKIDMSKDNDRLYLNGTVDTSTADIDGGQGTDIIFLNMTYEEWTANTALQGVIVNFEKAVFENNVQVDL